MQREPDTTGHNALHSCLWSWLMSHSPQTAELSSCASAHGPASNLSLDRNFNNNLVECQSSQGSTLSWKGQKPILSKELSTFKTCIKRHSFIQFIQVLINKYVYVSVQFSHLVMSDSLRPHGLQHARPPCPSPTPGVYSNSCPSSQWCHPTISSSVIPFSSCRQSFLASGSFPMSQSFASGGQSIGVSPSASVLAMNIQDWFPLGWTGLISLQSKGLSRVFSKNTVQKHQFFSALLSL